MTKPLAVIAMIIVLVPSYFLLRDLHTDASSQKSGEQAHALHDD